tara:strand:- start:26 stop:508 length:483 start_codon:yes stop_codon:yes gene_type:complete
MAITRLSNQSLTSVTALPAAISTGKVLQCITATDDTVRNTSSTSFVTSSNTLSVDITPSATSSKIFVMVSTTVRIDNQVAQGFITVYRDSTNLGNSYGLGNSYSDDGGAIWTPSAVSVLDSPSSTSQLTYQVYLRTSNASIPVRVNQDSRGTITVMEIAG